MTPNRIGVFDSGVGGLSVLKNLLETNKFQEIIYYGDTARVPYGTRSKEVIINYSLEALSFFEKFDLDLLVVACNTVSAYGLEAMQKSAKYPVVGVIEPGVLALQNKITNLEDKILILGTKATISSNLYQELLVKKGYKNLEAKATSLFVPLVEEGVFSGNLLKECMEYYFKDLKTPEAIILGCTHFPLIREAISNYFNNEPLLIHSGEAIVEYLERFYTLAKKEQETKVRFFASDSVENLEKTAKLWLGN
ncbi:glutamate racemase [Helicobacter valdiviensis]|uniref:Glutamate racemase n=1 Tax=Helicobacter valdiviensis TaxID=1458358 RepID=A0A2W6MXM9_9HELI|nr:glutamate racemase [Helicobacter valdiviensis]PZT47958.1 glutamate racemase [Helicobacter valdiviensis]